MPGIAKHWGTIGQQIDSRQVAWIQVSEAAANFGTAFSALRSALREDAQLRASEALFAAKRVLSDGGVRIQRLVNRVPAVGPWLVMELHRGKGKHEATGEELYLHPSNYEDASASVDTTIVEYLECIGCHVA